MKKVVTWLLMLAVMLSLLTLPATAGKSDFFLIANDTLVEPSPKITPIQHGGWIYIPMDVFNRKEVHVNFRVNCALTAERERLVLFDLTGKNMTFHLESGTVSVSGGQKPIPGGALYQNGIYYVPAHGVCQFFGLSCSYRSSAYGSMLRIGDGSQQLDDGYFEHLLQERWQQENVPPEPAPEPIVPDPPRPVHPAHPARPVRPVRPPEPTQPAPGPSAPAQPEAPVIRPDQPPTAPPPHPDPPEKRSGPSFSMRLGIRAEPGQDLTDLFHAMDWAGAEAVVFFPADHLTEMTAQIRQAAGRGYTVGLIPAGETPEQQEQSLAAGSQFIARVLYQETWFVLGQEPSAVPEGYLSWTPDFLANGETQADPLYESVVSVGADHDPPARVLLPGNLNADVLCQALDRWVSDGDRFLSARETFY